MSISSSSSPKAAPASSHVTSTKRGSEPPRKQAERQGQKDRFAEKMQRDEEGNGADKRGKTSASKAENSALGATLKREHDDTSGDQSSLGQNEIQRQMASAQGSAPASQPSGAGIDIAMLQRMAAQIADNVSGRLASEASIQFSDGALAEAAHIRREPDGSIAIRVAGLDPRLTAQQAGRAQLELLNGLAMRRLKVQSLSLERSKVDQRSFKSAIPRVV